MPSPININMADLPSDETELAYSTDTLLQLNSGEKTSVGEECPTMYKLKQYLRQPRRGVRFTTANPRELRTVDDDGNEHPFREESYEALEHFLPYLNHLQNEHGPTSKGQLTQEIPHVKTSRPLWVTSRGSTSSTTRPSRGRTTSVMGGNTKSGIPEIHRSVHHPDSDLTTHPLDRHPRMRRT